MDKDELIRRWEPIGPVTEGTVPSYQAKGPDGQFVQVHRIPREMPEFGRMFSLIQRILVQPPPDLVEVGEFEGGVAVVTHILPGQVALEDWLQESVARLEGDSSPSTEEPEASEPQSDSGYSSYFQIPEAGEPAVEPGIPQEPAGGESYTALFDASTGRQQQGLPEPQEDVAPAVPPPPPPPPPPPRAAPPPPPPPASPPTAAPSPLGPVAPSPPDTGSITDMFRKPEAPPPGRPEPQRPQRWDEPERSLSPLQLTLDEYIRRLEQS